MTASVLADPQRKQYAIRARWIGNGVYVRKEDLLRWFDSEAVELRKLGSTDKEKEIAGLIAEHVESIAADLRKVRAG